MEQPKPTPVHDLFKATWHKALIVLIAFFVILGILVLITNTVVYFSSQMNPNVMGIMSGFISLLFLLVPIYILLYVLYVLIKAK